MDKELTPTAKCFLVATMELARRKKIASTEGLIKILRGEEDEETLSLRDMIGFASCLSLKAKRGKMLLHSLVLNRLLDQKFIEGDYFLALNDLGQKIALESEEKVKTLSFKTKKTKPATIRDI